MNPSHGNMPYECNPNFSWSSQNPPPLINYPQYQSFQYMNNNQNTTFSAPDNSLNNNQNPTFSTPNNLFPFLPVQTLESTPYQPQQTLGIPFSFQTPPPLPTLSSILVPDNSSMVVQVIGEIESESGSFKNGVRELYIGSYGYADQDPYYSIRKKLISPFFPYLEVTGCWPNEEVQDDIGAEVNSVGNTRKSRKKKLNLFSCITWNLTSTSNIPNPEPPIRKTSKNLKFLFMKELCGSDVNNLKRIILPKSEAESHLPSLEEKTGIKVLMRDVLLSVTWRMKFRFWYNNRSRIYVLEHAGDFVKKHELKCGDAIALYRDETKQIYIYARKKPLPNSSSNQVISPPSGQEINMGFPNPIENLQNNGLDVGEPSNAQQGPTNLNLSHYLKEIEDKLLFDDYGPISTNYNNGLNVGESSSSQQGLVNFNNSIRQPMFDEYNGISTNGLINAETFIAQEGLLMECNSVSKYLNERHEVSPIFNQSDLPSVDLRPGNQDDCTIYK